MKLEAARYLKVEAGFNEIQKGFVAGAVCCRQGQEGFVFERESKSMLALGAMMRNGLGLGAQVASRLQREIAGEDAMDAHWQEATAAWPRLKVQMSAYADLLVSIFNRDASPVSLEKLLPVDLYIVCACLCEVPGAHEAFTARYLKPLEGQLQGMGLQGTEIEDLAQSVRMKLFVAKDEQDQRIRRYVGGGRLGGLVQVMVTREAIGLLRSKRKVTVESETLFEMPTALSDPQLAVIRQECTEEFRKAFQSAVAGLQPRDRTLLRLQYIDQLSTDEIALLYGVHRATAFRWFTGIREVLSLETKRLLKSALSVEAPLLESLLQLVDSELELSMERLLQSEVFGTSPE